ncbi:MFS transporter, DHA1 family, inner membrane transport protein [Marinactinospora thermotolerans DSM 45154]|uniref:MFS transporter, DHA1 family, inner membrane transport protein n=2 Tax=Marinactinospora thermotolerans TaxID=531310 RepID=A0A1T4PFM4_9ACTN|nr:MFS transporter, DHA1 family, inner membrane transport protein [Marinactinospora thermotolerans DSM 45154]
MNIGMFNLGNAIGARFGGYVISAGLGDSSPNLAGGPLAFGALMVDPLIRLPSKKSLSGQRHPVIEQVC